MLRAEPTQQQRQHVLAESRAGTDHQRPGQLTVAVGQLALELVGQRQHPLRVAVYHHAPLGEARTAAAAVEQRLADLTLERAYLLADGRLADAQRLGGGREGAAVGDLG
jgi:hypothetical protein